MCFTYIHGKALLCATSIVSIVTTAVAAVALKMKPKMKTSTIIGYDYEELRPAIWVAHACCVVSTLLVTLEQLMRLIHIRRNEVTV